MCYNRKDMRSLPHSLRVSIKRTVLTIVFLATVSGILLWNIFTADTRSVWRGQLSTFLDSAGQSLASSEAAVTSSVLAAPVSSFFSISSAQSLCGNGLVDSAQGEECDDFLQNSDTTPNACRTDCRLPRCGDGVTDTTPTHFFTTTGFVSVQEQCDDGNSNDFDGCTQLCIRLTSTFKYSCPKDCSTLTTSVDQCVYGTAQSHSSTGYRCRGAFPPAFQASGNACTIDSCPDGSACVEFPGGGIQCRSCDELGSLETDQHVCVSRCFAESSSRSVTGCSVFLPGGTTICCCCDQVSNASHSSVISHPQITSSSMGDTPSSQTESSSLFSLSSSSDLNTPEQTPVIPESEESMSSASTAITPFKRDPLCGNGHVDPNEECDNGSRCSGGERKNWVCTSVTNCYVPHGECLLGWCRNNLPCFSDYDCQDLLSCAYDAFADESCSPACLRTPPLFAPSSLAQ